MSELHEVAPVFVEMAHRIVWCSAATVDAKGRPRSRVLHPIWEWNGERLTGWIATSPTPLKRAHLNASPYISLNYWSPTHDTCVAECTVTWILDDEGRTSVWNRFTNGPAPVGYDPRMVQTWTSPTCEEFAGLKVEPWRLRIYPGSVRGSQVLKWREQ